MSTLRAEEDHLDDVEDFLATRKALKHLRARRRADTITIESGPKTDPTAHARIRRISVHRWALEMPNHLGQWEPTPYTNTLEPLLAQLVKDFPWALAPVDS
jgi:hypothetical protein